MGSRGRRGRRRCGVEAQAGEEEEAGRRGSAPARRGRGVERDGDGLLLDPDRGGEIFRGGRVVRLSVGGAGDKVRGVWAGRLGLGWPSWARSSGGGLLFFFLFCFLFCFAFSFICLFPFLFISFKSI